MRTIPFQKPGMEYTKMANPMAPQSQALSLRMAATMPEGTAIRTPTIMLASTRHSVGRNASPTRRFTCSWIR